MIRTTLSLTSRKTAPQKVSATGPSDEGGASGPAVGQTCCGTCTGGPQPSVGLGSLSLGGPPGCSHSCFSCLCLPGPWSLPPSLLYSSALPSSISSGLRSGPFPALGGSRSVPGGQGHLLCAGLCLPNTPNPHHTWSGGLDTLGPSLVQGCLL